MSKFFTRQGMVVHKVHEIISFKQSKWLEKYISFNTQNRNQGTNNFDQDFYKLVSNALCEKTMRNVKAKLNIIPMKKDEGHKMVGWQPKPTFNGLHKSYENYLTYTFKQNEVLLDIPFYLGFAVLELSKVIIYATYYYKLQPCFGEKDIQFHYMDTDSFVLSVNTNDSIEDLQSLNDLFDFISLDKNKVFSKKNIKVLVKFKIERLKKLSMDDFICLRNKAFSFKCNDQNTQTERYFKITR